MTVIREIASGSVADEELFQLWLSRSSARNRPGDKISLTLDNVTSTDFHRTKKKEHPTL